MYDWEERGLYTYPRPKLGTVNRFTRRDILGSGNVERVVILFTVGAFELDPSLLFWGSEVDRCAYRGGSGQGYRC